MVTYKLSWKKVCKICENNQTCHNIKNKEEAMTFFENENTKISWLVAILKAGGLNDRFVYDQFNDRGWFTGVIDNLFEFDFSEEGELESEPTPITDICMEDISIKDISEWFEQKKEDIDFENIELDVSATTIYENVPVEFHDEFLIKYSDKIFPWIVAICLSDKVVATGHLQLDDSHNYRIILKQKDILYDEFKGNTLFQIILFDKTLQDTIKNNKIDIYDYAGKVYKLDCNIDYEEMETAQNTLCVDFGTSNTSAGSYGILDEQENNIELVSFTDVTSDEMKEVKVLPTIVYVEDCSAKEHIKYIFGYEAKKIVSDNEYDTKASVFFEIKRWISTLDEEQQIKDCNGKTLTVKRRDIVKAYLEHVISLSEQYFKRKFKTLHFSAPVKLKEKYYNEIKSMLPGYNILPPDSTLDEGIAIIYNSIRQLIDVEKIKPSDSDDNPTKIMILDCGGGTTDLASCEVKYRKYKATNKLHITTKFVNGNSNFGGNNITFRIMQLLKIKLAYKYNKDKFNKDFSGDCDASKLIPMEENTILNEIEKSYDSADKKQYNSDTANTIYSDFINYYEKSEEVIPTVFVDNKNCKFEGELRKIKRNYYYLWQLAEKIKIKFYDEDDVQIYFDPNDEDKIIEFDTPQNYYLYVREEGALVRKDRPADDIKITVKDLRRVLYGDIYGLINELLKTKGLKIDDYNYYRLSGQSCKINLFMELLKEFIPGNKLRTDSCIKNSDYNNSSIKLKLDCINGGIAYIRDKECGHINPEMETDKPKLIYDVYTREVNNDNLLIAKESKDQNSNQAKRLRFVAFTQKASKAEIFVNNIFGNRERKLSVLMPNDNYKPKDLEALFTEIKGASFLDSSTIDELKNEVSGIKPSEYDSAESVRIILAIPSKEGYGMNIYRVKVEEKVDAQIFSSLEVIYENFENESTKSFFDGKR